MWRVTREKSLPFAVCFLDLDGFKEVNDTLGHAKGDKLLKAVSERIKKAFREDDFVGRLSGDEFILIVEGGDIEQELMFPLDRIIKSLSEDFNLYGEVANVSASIGVSLYPEQGETIQELLSKADQAMYRAKHSGKNHYQFY